MDGGGREAAAGEAEARDQTRTDAGQEIAALSAPFVQRIRLQIDGIGADNANIKKVEFVIDQSTVIPGYPARKEILVEVDRAAIINNVPGAGNDTNAKLKTILNGASGVFSNAARGAGIYMYWLMDEDALNLTKNDLDTDAKLDNVSEASRDTAASRTANVSNLASDFLHVLFVDETGSGSSTGDRTLRLAQRASVMAVTDMKNNHAANNLNAAKFNERLMVTTAHELVHLLIEKRDGAFNANEHTSNADEIGQAHDANDKTDLMYLFLTPGRTEIDTVRLFPVVQAEIRVKNNQGLVE